MLRLSPMAWGGKQSIVVSRRMKLFFLLLKSCWSFFIRIQIVTTRGWKHTWMSFESADSVRGVHRNQLKIESYLMSAKRRQKSDQFTFRVLVDWKCCNWFELFISSNIAYWQYLNVFSWKLPTDEGMLTETPLHWLSLLQSMNNCQLHDTSRQRP